MAWPKFLRSVAVPDERDRRTAAPVVDVAAEPASGTVASTPDLQLDEAPAAEHLLLPTLLGIQRLATAPMTRTEQQFVDHIDALRATAAAELPRLPVVLPQLMRLLRREDVGPRALAACVAHDPALVGEVVRLANSAPQAAGRRVADLSQAISLLGERGLTQLVSRVALRPVFAAGLGRASAACAPRLWALAERGAVACGAAVAGPGEAPVELFHAYLAGLIAPVGAILAVRRLDTLAHRGALTDSDAFYRALHAATARAAARVGRQWQFPEPVCAAVEQLAERASAADRALTAALRVATRAAAGHLLLPALSEAGQLSLSDAERRCHAALNRAFDA